jgi:hypothetical protein
VGCGDGTDFCPTAFTFRSQMAAFVARSLAGNDAAVPSSSGDYNCATGPSQFTDVPITNGFCKHINYLKDVKVANGCTLTEFCPQNDVTRGQMAIFIARAWEVQQGNTADPEGSIPLFGNDATGDRFYNCDSVDHANTGSAPTVDPIPANTAPFTDVASSGLVCKSAGLLFVQHIIDGFGDGSYHPAAFIRRDQAAKILTNAFVSLPLYGPLTF